MFDGFVCGGALYLKFAGESSDGTALYDEYELSDVIVREKLAFSENAVNESRVTVYFISKKSKCSATGVGECPLPRPREHDMCTLHAGTEDEITLRVAEAGYFIGRGNIEYVRLALR